MDLTPQEEIQYQKWLRVPGSEAHNWKQAMQNYIDKVAPGEKVELNPDNYDYRAAFKDGFEPSVSEDDGMYHWTSKYKSEDHPTAWMEHFYLDYGADPNKVSKSKSDYSFLKQMTPNNSGLLRYMFTGDRSKLDSSGEQ